MKTTWSVRLAGAALAATGALVLAGCAASPGVEVAPAPQPGTVLTYEVFGMDCPGCHGGLEKLVRAIDGVTDAKASWQEKRVTLTVAEDAEVSDAEVREAIARANFTAGERLP